MDISKIIKESIDEYNRIRCDSNSVVSCVGCVFAKNLNLNCESMRDCDECYIQSFTKMIEDSSLCDDICDISKNDEAEYMRVVAKKYYLEAIDDFNTRCRNDIETAAYTGHLSCTVSYSGIDHYIIKAVKKRLENDGYVVTLPYDDASLKISWD